MKKLLALVMVFAMLLSICAFSASADSSVIFYNDFNDDADWEDNIPKGYLAWMGEHMSRLTDGGIDGSGAWRVASESGVSVYANNGVADAQVLGGNTYRFSCKYKVVDDDGYGFFFHLQYITSDPDADTASMTFISRYEWGEEEGLTGSYISPEASDEWIDFEVIWTVPNEATAVRFGPQVYDGYILIIDDMKIEEIDPNAGDDNTGDDNTGDDNTGDDNTGDNNTGDDNTGDDNTGDDNTGDDNTGDDNSSSETGDATVLFAVMAIVALFGTALVAKKAR